MKKYMGRTQAPQWLALPIVALLAACGGGSGDSPGNTNTQTQSLKVSGTVATGAALSGASISVVCASGSDTTKSASDGTYSLSLANGSLPCVITATSADGASVLHSIVPGSGSGSATSNVTPLSELLVAQLAASDPAAFVAAFNSGTTISSDAVASAETAVLAMLHAAGVDVSAVSSILGGSLQAGSGKGYDGVLDALQTTITSAGTSLSELTSAVATSSGTGDATGGATVSTVLAPASSDCAAFKSGVHRIVNFAASTSSLVTIDTQALTATVDGVHYAMTRNASCDYTVADGDNTRVLVAKSGMAVWVTGGTSGGVGISVPEQKLDLASLAGVYNRVSYSGASSDTGDFGSVTINAAGVNTTSTNCPSGYGSCAVDPKQPLGHLVADADGGFDYIDDGQGGSVASRVFAFRNAAGKTAMLVLQADGTMTVLGSQLALPLPSVGNTSAYWQFSLSSTGPGSVTEDANVVTAVDSGAGAVTRQFTSDSHFDVVTFNTPFGGTRYRAVNACTTSAGAASTCNGAVQLPLQGSGIVLSVSAVASKHTMTISINKP